MWSPTHKKELFILFKSSREKTDLTILRNWCLMKIDIQGAKDKVNEQR